MGPIETLLLALAVKAGETVFSENVKKANEKLISLIKKKFKQDRKAEFALEGFLDRPDAYRELLATFLRDYNVIQNNEIRQLAKEIVDVIGRDPQKAFLEYLRFTARESQYISLQGLDIKSSDPQEEKKVIELSKVYVDLNTTQAKRQTGKREEPFLPDEKEQKLLSVKEAVVGEKNVLLLGDPGSGKSTFMSYLAYGLAMNGLKEDDDRFFDDWPPLQQNLTPIKIVLRDFARQLDDDDKPDKARCLLDFIITMLKDNALQDAENLLKDALEGSAYVLLDGFDEIGMVGKREAVQQAISAFVKRYPDNRYVVTCRTRSYEEYGWKVPGFHTFELASFNAGQISRFIETWYRELERQEQIERGTGEMLIGRLKEAIKRPDINELAPNPLLLTVMTLVHAHKGELPDARVLLYKEAVDILMYRWDSIKVRGEMDNPTLLQLLQQADRDKVDIENIFCRLAFDTKGAQVDEKEHLLADLSAYDLERSLAELKYTDKGKPDRNWARDIVETLKLRAGLLVERAPGIFTFPHRTFQEYLAAVHLASQPKYVKETVRLTENIAYWREVILLSVGVKVYVYKQFSDILTPLACELTDDKNKSDYEGWRCIALAGDILREMKIKRVCDTALGRSTLENTQQLHVEILRHNRLPARERADVGVTLAHLSDPRDEILKVDQMPFCLVPGGNFWMGEEKNVHLNKELQHDFWAAQFPVSNAQFHEFVRQDGYASKSYWKEAEKAGFWQKGRFKGKYDSGWRAAPFDFGAPYNLANHPVVGVSWYEALAFCRWMDERFRDLLGDWHVRLISEAEWEKAARGGLKISESPIILRLSSWPFENEFPVRDNPQPKRDYPWLAGEMTENASFGKTGVSSTSALGCFSGGRSPLGCEEMSGNVWEWTRCVYKSYPYKPKSSENEQAGPGDSRPAGRFLLRLCSVCALCVPLRVRSVLQVWLCRVPCRAVPPLIWSLLL
ncbi:MAG: SUMF1/EgtB/PvdO family nonheme iron enzyme [Actinobacteria bacterium]|nr:SUMF1/EgtB/PvdO family nonheme iron enzyme [Actinomycetota bacterium]